MTPIGERERERERDEYKSGWLLSAPDVHSMVIILIIFFSREREREKTKFRATKREGNVQHKNLQELGTNYPRPIDQSLATTHQREKSQARNDDRLIIRNPKKKRT